MPTSAHIRFYVDGDGATGDDLDHDGNGAAYDDIDDDSDGAAGDEVDDDGDGAKLSSPSMRRRFVVITMVLLPS
jgi:hypothetical protein